MQFTSVSPVYTVTPPDGLVGLSVLLGLVLVDRSGTGRLESCSRAGAGLEIGEK
jgi:hypothetical protein